MSEIRFEQVSHDFGAERVVDDVTLVLRERRVGIVGANGSGKSTLARMINGLVTPASGRVVVDGLDVARQGREVRRRVGFVFTNADNQIVMPTVREDVAFTLRRHRLEKADAAARVDAALDRVGLTDLADRPAHRLSGGQKQLLAIASVLVAEPAIVVADEPTTLLDARNARRVAEHFELARPAARGRQPPARAARVLRPGRRDGGRAHRRGRRPRHRARRLPGPHRMSVPA